MSKNNFVRAAVLSALASSMSLAHATNGDQMLGVTATQWGMAGAVVAAPQDAGTVLTNPAGLAGLDMEEFRVDMGFGFMNPPRKANGEESDSNLYMIPSGAMAVKVDEQMTFGMGMAGLSGMGVDFADIVSAAPGNQAVVTTKQFYKIAPGFSYQVNDQLALGAALNIDYQSLAIHNAAFTLPQNQVYGFGATLGLTYQANDKVRIGASYISEQDMSEFEWNTTAGTYAMTMDAPQMIQVGVAFTPSDDLLIEADIKHIAFSDVLDSIDFKTPAGTTKMNFGWDDQTVFALGVQKQVNPKTAVRVGYNYGESPIGPEDVDNNIGSLAVTEQHLSFGVTRQLGEKMFGSLSYVHAFSNEVTSNSGSNNTIELEQNVLNLQITYKN